MPPRRPQPRGAGSQWVSGFLRDDQGTALPGVEVVLASPRGGFVQQTDRDGWFCFEGVMGMSSLRVRGAGSLASREEIAWRGLPQAEPIDLVLPRGRMVTIEAPGMRARRALRVNLLLEDGSHRDLGEWPEDCDVARLVCQEDQPVHVLIGPTESGCLALLENAAAGTVHRAEWIRGASLRGRVSASPGVLGEDAIVVAAHKAFHAAAELDDDGDFEFFLPIGTSWLVYVVPNRSEGSAFLRKQILVQEVNEDVTLRVK